MRPAAVLAAYLPDGWAWGFLVQDTAAPWGGVLPRPARSPLTDLFGGQPLQTAVWRWQMAWVFGDLLPVW